MLGNTDSNVVNVALFTACPLVLDTREPVSETTMVRHENQ